MKSRLQILIPVMRELSCAMRSSFDFLTSSFAACWLNWLLNITVGEGGGLQNSFSGSGAEQPQVIELLVYNVGEQLSWEPCSPRTTHLGGYSYGGGGELVVWSAWTLHSGSDMIKLPHFIVDCLPNIFDLG